ncbi:MAG: Polyphenol oxidase [Candidatus Tokpelaia hoelldobleri]|uniref:Purine nucleoside phosphorylase n=1 Tax=Candidatus Tokpelaia hoelldobleri TaxID=1902579 RepID=A0A1U9JVK9_9HYPH|nr:MAG: Polyphenol oxidase [Candidatus Tokpelaia hoelldoblerii]
MPDTLQPVLAPLLATARQNGIAHGFFTREGGVSHGIYHSLNVGRGSDDVKAHVAENRRRVAAHLGVKPGRLATVHQVHSADVITLDAPFDSTPPKADAMVTGKAGLALAVLTADCGPVLFADEKARIIGAAHAGWRGALAGVLENTMAAMEQLGARRSNITAILGPAIGTAHYETGAEFYDTFTAVNPACVQFFTPSVKTGHFMFNLQAFILERLQASGVKAGALGLCTYADERRFFSYRRTTHRNEADYGRQMSAIVLNHS